MWMSHRPFVVNEPGATETEAWALLDPTELQIPGGADWGETPPWSQSLGHGNFFDHTAWGIETLGVTYSRVYHTGDTQTGCWPFLWSQQKVDHPGDYTDYCADTSGETGWLWASCGNTDWGVYTSGISWSEERSLRGH